MTQENRPTILVVDDVPENITVISAMLRDQYRVLFATSGDEALEVVADEHIDLILLDVMMPDMDGYEVCRRLKSRIETRDIPVIFVTALTDSSDQARGLELGAVDYLHKPCPTPIVRLRVRLHLEQHNQSLALERRVRERTAELEDTRREVVRRLGRAAEYRDNETGLHVIRMSQSAHVLALAAGLPAAQAELILNAAPMHDVGKIGIPDLILLKPGKLSDEEWAVMKTHAEIGADIIGEHSSDLLQMARNLAAMHHEKWDGSGYPRGLAGEAIALEARIVALADVYDALTSERPYKRAWTAAEAQAYLREQAGKAFDPHLVELFLGRIDEIEAIRARYLDVIEPRDADS